MFNFICLCFKSFFGLFSLSLLAHKLIDFGFSCSNIVCRNTHDSMGEQNAHNHIYNYIYIYNKKINGTAVYIVVINGNEQSEPHTITIIWNPDT